MQEEAAIGRPLAGMVSLVARGGALTATRQGGGVGAVHGVRFAAAVLKTSAKYLKPRIYLVDVTHIPCLTVTHCSFPGGGACCVSCLRVASSREVPRSRDARVLC